MALNGNQSHQTLRLRIARILGEPVSHGGGRAVQPFSLVVACVALALGVSLLAVPPVAASLRPAMHGALIRRQRRFAERCRDWHPGPSGR